MPLWHAVNGRMLPALALHHLRAADVSSALRVAQRVARTAAAAPRSAPQSAALTQLVREFGKARSPAGVYACLDVMASAPPAAGADVDAGLMQERMPQKRCLGTRHECTPLRSA